jgi:hypothetical protein
VASGLAFGERKTQLYRKRRPLPAIIVILVLCIGAFAVWLNAITNKTDVNDAVRCSPAATPPPGVTFTPLPHNALDDASPLAPDKIAIKVLNASNTRGQGAITTGALRALGFTQVGEPQNDPAYENQVPRCRGQLRFGSSGASAARTVSLLAPCVELVRDNRTDASVDLAIGDTFGQLQPRPEGRQIIQQLITGASQQRNTGEQAVDPTQPVIDKKLMEAARDVQC